ncbi:hypothetical protein [Rathayibacter tritici]|uniref:hypothetical protein n=1 Tax=Rathayibacter tritici TaxID=33888 RepID=UPI0012F895A6|nr:hypothetical protein [Rathayibacter tritici]
MNTRSEVLDGWTAAEQEETSPVDRILGRRPQRERDAESSSAALDTASAAVPS